MSRPNLEHLEDRVLNEYLDGALSPSARTAAQAHLDSCAGCAQRMIVLRSLSSRLSGLPEISLQRDLRASVLAALRPLGTRRAPGRWRAAVAAQLVAGLLVLGLAWPVVSPLLPRLAPAGLSPILPLDASASLDGWSSVWFSAAPELEAAIAFVGAWPSQAPHFGARWLEFGLTLILATGVWILGNRLLLGPLGRPAQTSLPKNRP